jgi:serine/threonine protein kinase
MVERGASVTRHVASELFLHRACSGHPLFVQLRDVFLTPKHLAIVMEHVPGGDILELVNEQGALPEEEARWLFQQVVVGLLYLHSKGSKNREIKLQNKLISWPNDNNGGDGDGGVDGGATASINTVVAGSGSGGVTTNVASGLVPLMTNGILSAAAAAAAAAKENEEQSGTPMERSPSPGPLAGVGASTAELDAVSTLAGGSGAADGELPDGIGAGGASAATAATAAAVLRSGRPAVKIQDFAYSKSEQINSDPHSALGSLPYTAPEVLNNTMTESCAADVWALGVALYKMVTGMYPFERPEDVKEARSAVQAVLGRIARVEYSIPEHLSPDLRDLLERMLVRDPVVRMKLDQILDHPWMKNNISEELLRLNSTVDCTSAGPMTEDALKELVSEAQVNLRPLDSENVDDLADEILDEEEADELLDELSLGGYYD